MSRSQTATPPEVRREHMGRLEKRVRELIAGREREVEAALEAGDASTLERVADEANALRIQGQAVRAEEVEISGAPTLAEMRIGEEDRKRARDDLLSGRLVGELFFAGAATRFAQVARGPLYFLDVWEVAERVLQAGTEEVPPFAKGMSREEYARIHQATRRAATALPPARRISLPLGPRILVSYRASLERLCRESGARAEEVRRRTRLVVHLPESPDGQRILEDFAARRFFGFDPRNVLFIPQPFYGGFVVKKGAVVPLAGSREFPYGHGYSTLQLAEQGSGWLWSGEKLVRLEEAPLSWLSRQGSFSILTHRVNDLTLLSPNILDLERLAASRRLLEQGHRVAVELVANPGGQKGGNWVLRRASGHRFLVEGMNARTGGWPEFLERHRGAPYNAFRNLYDGPALSSILRETPLPYHLRIRKLESPPVGLYLEAVTGDITQIPMARAAAFRRDEREQIHDLKELKDLPEGVDLAAREDQDEDFRRVAAERA